MNNEEKTEDLSKHRKKIILISGSIAYLITFGIQCLLFTVANDFFKGMISMWAIVHFLEVMKLLRDKLKQVEASSDKS